MEELQAELQRLRESHESQMKQIHDQIAALTPSTPLTEKFVDTRQTVNLNSPDLGVIKNRRMRLHPAIPAIKQASTKRLGVQAPAAFTGTGGSSVDVCVQFESWRAKIALYFEYIEASNGSEMTDDERVLLGMQLLDGEALHTAIAARTNLQQRHPRTAVSWTEVLSALEAVYQLTTNLHLITDAVKKVKQVGSVMDYTARFNAAHRRLIALGEASKASATDMYIGGLREDIGRLVRADLLRNNTLKDYGRDDVAAVVARLQEVAQSIEIVCPKPAGEATISDSPTSQSNPNQTSQGNRSAWGRGNQQSNYRGHGNSQGWNNYRGNRGGHRNRNNHQGQVNALSLAASFAKTLGVSEAIVEQRLANDQCLNCGLAGHKVRACKKMKSNSLQMIEAFMNALFDGNDAIGEENKAAGEETKNE